MKNTDRVLLEQILNVILANLKPKFYKVYVDDELKSIHLNKSSARWTRDTWLQDMPQAKIKITKSTKVLLP